MALSIRDERAEAAAREPTDQIMAIARRCASLADLDRRTAGEIIGYRQGGMIG